MFGAVVVLALAVALALGAFDQGGNKLGELALVGGPGHDVYTIDADGGNLVKLTRGDTPAWAPDGRRLAFVAPRGAGTVLQIAACDGATRDVALSGTAPTFSPTGRLAYLRSGQVYVTEAGGTAAREAGRTGGALALAWSPDGRRLAVERNRRGSSAIAVLDVTGGSERTVAERGRAPAWSRDGRLAWLGPAGVAVRDWRGTVTTLPGTRGASRVAWSPDGSTLAVAGQDGGGAPPTVRFTGRPTDDAPSWSPDGRRLAFLRAAAGGVSEAMVLDVAQGAVRRVDNAPPVRSAAGLAWRPGRGC